MPSSKRVRRTTCCCRPGPGMEQSIEGITRKPGSGVACTPRGRFWGHDVKGSMRELLLDAQISIRCMEDCTGRLDRVTFRATGLQRSNRIAGFGQRWHSKFEPGSCYRACNGSARFRVFSVASRLSRVSCVRQYAVASPNIHGACNAVSRSCRTGTPRPSASNTAHRHARVSSLSHTTHRQFICT